MGMTGFLIGTWVDRFGPRPLMIVGATVLAITLALHALVDSVWQWLLLNGVLATIGGALLGNLVVFVTGFSASRLLSPKYNAKKELTVYQRSIQTEGKKCDE